MEHRHPMDRLQMVEHLKLEVVQMIVARLRFRQFDLLLQKKIFQESLQVCFGFGLCFCLPTGPI